MNETFPPITSARFPSDVTSAFLMSKRSSSASYPRQGNIMQTFQTLGHHNDLQSSLRRAEKDIHEQVYTPISGCQRPSTQKFVTSNRKLRDYSHSICDDIGDVKNFRKTLFEERARQRGVHLLKNKSSLNLGLSSISFRLLTGSSQAPSLPSAMIDVKIDPLTSAKAKLSKFSMSFDPATKENQRMISGFHGQRLSRESFGVLIRQAMHIVLSIPEVDVIYGTMDVSQDGTFDGREFTRKFFNLGNAARREKYTGMARDSSNYPGNRMMSYMEKESER